MELISNPKNIEPEVPDWKKIATLTAKTSQTEHPEGALKACGRSNSKQLHRRIQTWMSNSFHALRAIGEYVLHWGVSHGVHVPFSRGQSA